MSLELLNISVAYGEHLAVRHVYLTVRAGEIVGVVGENAAGKTSTARVIAGTLSPNRGMITVDGDSVLHLPSYDRIRAGLTVVPEGRGIVPTLTVRDNLWLGLYARHGHNGRREITALEEEIPLLRERRRQLAGTLSGGEQQVLALARARLSQPKYLVLDEPLVGLSPANANRALDAIRALPASSGIGILIFEQSDHTVRSVAMRVYMMRDGEIHDHLGGSDARRP